MTQRKTRTRRTTAPNTSEKPSNAEKETVEQGVGQVATGSAEATLQAILDDPTASTSEKISAARALASIQDRRAGGGTSGLLSMSRAEIVAEIKALRADLGLPARK